MLFIVYNVLFHIVDIVYLTLMMTLVIIQVLAKTITFSSSMTS